MNARRSVALGALAAVSALLGCSSNAAPVDCGVSAPIETVATGETASDGVGTPFCAQSGSDEQCTTAPQGFCVRKYATVPEARVLVFAPNGDLFVSSPSLPSTGGAQGGLGAIVVLSDDNHDGSPDRSLFLEGLIDVHGLAFAPGFLYFTTASAVFRVAYSPGQRRAQSAPERVAGYGIDGARWAHSLAISSSGRVITGVGVGDARACTTADPEGLMLELREGALSPLVTGFRNPAFARCHFADDLCLVSELGDDSGQRWGAHEKLVRVVSGTNYGFPCCAGPNAPSKYNASMSCATVSLAEAQFPLNDTPFGLDWERGRWPQPFRGGIFVALHGSFYSTPQFEGSRIVFAPADPRTHLPSGAFRDVLRGFGEGGGPMERATDLAFSPDGRLFFSDDQHGAVYWMAPSTLRRPAS